MVWRDSNGLVAERLPCPYASKSESGGGAYSMPEALLVVAADARWGVSSGEDRQCARRDIDAKEYRSRLWGMCLH